MPKLALKSGAASLSALAALPLAATAAASASSPSSTDTTSSPTCFVQPGEAPVCADSFDAALQLTGDPSYYDGITYAEWTAEAQARQAAWSTAQATTTTDTSTSTALGGAQAMSLPGTLPDGYYWEGTAWGNYDNKGPAYVYADPNPSLCANGGHTWANFREIPGVALRSFTNGGCSTAKFYDGYNASTGSCAGALLQSVQGAAFKTTNLSTSTTSRQICVWLMGS